MLAVFPLTAARDRHWWSHCRSLGSPEMSTSFFARQLKKGQWTCHTHQWFRLQLVESSNCREGHCISGICRCQHQLLHCFMPGIAALTLTTYLVTFCKGIHNCRIPYKAPAPVPRVQGQTIRLLLSLVKPTGSRTEGRPMRVNDRLRMELMAECLGKRPAFLMKERPVSPSLSTNLPQRHSVLSKILAPVRRAIAIRSSSGLSRFPTLAIGKASDQAAVWLFCAVSSRQWFQGLRVSSRTVSESLQERSYQADCVSFHCGDES